MCVIMYKPIGKVLKSDLIRQCFRANPDGAGYMYPYEGKVRIKKGFMTEKELFESLQKTVDELGGTTKSIPMILHFRISTQGGVNPEITHPYPVCDSYDDMKVLDTFCELAMCHNGVMREFSDNTVKGHNDSMEYIKEFAYPLIKHSGKMRLSKKTEKLLNLGRGSSRLAFMDAEGSVSLLGQWQEYQGYMFSNGLFNLASRSKLWNTIKDL